MLLFRFFVAGEINNWIRLATLLHVGICEALLMVLHNDSKEVSYTGLPRNPKDLYREFSTTHKQKLRELRSDGTISKEQWHKLFPKSNNKSYSKSFDITLISIVIINCTDLPAPSTGWNHKLLPTTDGSKSANVLRAREWRNDLIHTVPCDIDQNIFKRKWNEGETIIQKLGYEHDIMHLKKVSLDPKTSKKVSSWLLKSPADDTVGKLQRWLRLTVLLHNGIQPALLAVLHRGMPSEPKALYNELCTVHGCNLKVLETNGTIHPGQLGKLFPVTRESFSQRFDIPLIAVLINNCTFQVDIKSAIVQARQWRNDLLHTVPSEFDENTFKRKWKEGERIIQELRNECEIKHLKKVSVDPKTSKKAVVNKWLFKLNKRLSKLLKLLCLGFKNIKKYVVTKQLFK